MLVGLEPVAAYRTLNLPALEPLSSLARGPLGDDRIRASVRKAMRDGRRRSACTGSLRDFPGTMAGQVEGKQG